MDERFENNFPKQDESTDEEYPEGISDELSVQPHRDISIIKKLFIGIRSLSKIQVIIIIIILMLSFSWGIFAYYSHKSSGQDNSLNTFTITPIPTDVPTDTPEPIPTDNTTNSNSDTTSSPQTISNVTPTIDCIGPDGKHLYITQQQCDTFNNAWATPTPTPSPTLIPTDTPTVTPTSTPTDTPSVTPTPTPGS